MIKSARPFAWALAILMVVVFYAINRRGGFAGNIVYRTALAEAQGDPVGALKRLGPAYLDRDGDLIYLTLQRTIARIGKAVGLPDYQLGNDILKKVNQIASIRHLTIGHPTWIDDAGMRHIAKMQQLQTLSLKFTPLTSAGLSDLQSLSNLQVLYVSTENLTAADARAFESKVPGCEVVLWPDEADRPSAARIRLQVQLVEDVKAARLSRFQSTTN